MKTSNEFHENIARDLNALGGILMCDVCETTMPLGDVVGKLRAGWPECCGYTMRWWTQRQVDAGEAPRVGEDSTHPTPKTEQR